MATKDYSSSPRAVFEDDIAHLDGLGTLDEVHPVEVVLLHACADGEDVRVKDDVCRVETQLWELCEDGWKCVK